MTTPPMRLTSAPWRLKTPSTESVDEVARPRSGTGRRGRASRRSAAPRPGRAPSGSANVRIADSTGPMHGVQPIANAAPVSSAPAERRPAGLPVRAVLAAEHARREPDQRQAHHDHEEAADQLQRPPVVVEQRSRPADAGAVRREHDREAEHEEAGGDRDAPRVLLQVAVRDARDERQVRRARAAARTATRTRRSRPRTPSPRRPRRARSPPASQRRHQLVELGLGRARRACGRGACRRRPRGTSRAGRRRPRRAGYPPDGSNTFGHAHFDFAANATAAPCDRSAELTDSICTSGCALRERDQLRRLAAARAAPRGPEVDHHRAALVRREVERPEPSSASPCDRRRGRARLQLHGRERRRRGRRAVVLVHQADREQARQRR